MVSIVKAILKEENKRKKSNHPIKQIPMRPDHGHTIPVSYTHLRAHETG